MTNLPGKHAKAFCDELCSIFINYLLTKFFGREGIFTLIFFKNLYLRFASKSITNFKIILYSALPDQDDSDEVDYIANSGGLSMIRPSAIILIFLETKNIYNYR